MDPTNRPQWAADPYRRHELRYWDGVGWTDRVSDDRDLLRQQASPGLPGATPPTQHPQLQAPLMQRSAAEGPAPAWAVSAVPAQAPRSALASEASLALQHARLAQHSRAARQAYRGPTGPGMPPARSGGSGRGSSRRRLLAAAAAGACAAGVLTAIVAVNEAGLSRSTPTTVSAAGRAGTTGTGAGRLVGGGGATTSPLVPRQGVTTPGAPSAGGPGIAGSTGASTTGGTSGAQSSTSGATTASPSTTARRFSSCGALLALYPHGVGRAGAVDRGRRPRDTRFLVDAALYAANAARDYDHDGIVCERA